MTRFILMLISAACVSMFTDVGFAQEDATSGGTLRGQITDITLRQNPIEGVEVKIVAQDGGKEWTTKTDADGNYKHAGLPAGRYLISVSKDGYNMSVGKPVTIVDGGDHFVPLKMVQKGNIEPFFEVQQKRKDIAIKQEIKPRVESLLQGIAESVGRRYDLGTAAVDTLRLSILEAVEIALKRDRSIHLFAKAVEGGSVGLLKVLLSRLDCKVLFAKHLSEAQLQDYVNFAEARQQLDQQTVARWITAALDRELSLTADQREKVVGLLHGVVWNRAFLTSMSVLGISSQKAVHLVHYRLKISLDNILSEAQSKVWHGLVNTNANRDHFAVLMPEAEVKVVVADKKIDVGEAEVKVVVAHKKIDVDEIVDPNKKRAFIRKAAVKPVKIEKEVNVVINEVAIDPPGRLPPWVELNADTAESQAQMRHLAEAKLAAHTELLGPLTERAARRLALGAKGVAQQYTEAQDKTHDAMDELWGDEETNIDITEHPMYQQAIKDVLSEEAFAQYSTYQAEREVWYQQVLRDLVVACIDTQLLLDDTQREVLETAASQLIPGPLKAEKPAEFMFFQLFPQTVDFEILTPWQQDEFERVFGRMMWRE
ncbi:carboxypeptidase regulatory-like domain-containing protein [Candidatus Poribacteria bacterium]|nr:carboxypeptidase regulatory-like domain-containing protein [Candidatus Poribacteria bacterium]